MSSNIFKDESSAAAEHRPFYNEESTKQPFKCGSNNVPPGYIDLDGHDVVVLVASGWGLLAHVAYLLCESRKTATRLRRTHLVWQLEQSAEGTPARDLLNHALFEHTLDNGHVTPGAFKIIAVELTRPDFGNSDLLSRRPACLFSRPVSDVL